MGRSGTAVAAMIGGPVRSAYAWIDAQGWPDDVAREATLMTDDRLRIGLNPMTRGAWIAWADRRGVACTFGGA